jgi:hypothetical protein
MLNFIIDMSNVGSKTLFNLFATALQQVAVFAFAVYCSRLVRCAYIRVSKK